MRKRFVNATQKNRSRSKREPLHGPQTVARSHKTLRVVAVAALFAALSILCGKYFAISAGPVMRFSFENLPIMLTGMIFGPVVGLLTGVVADLVGCLMVGYQINPIVTLGAAAIGFLSGFLYRVIGKRHPFLRILVSVIAAHLVGSVLIKTFGLAKFYDMPFYAVLLWRLLNYVIVGGVELALCCYLMKNKAIKRQLERIDR